MISVPASIQSQLGETISVIADSDFWTRWDTLVDVSLCRRLCGCGNTTNAFVGLSRTSYTRQSKGQHRSVGSCTLDIQEMEAAFRIG